MQNKSKKHQQQGCCNRRVVNKGLSKLTQQAMRDAEYRKELRAIERAHSIGGIDYD
jgi:hypothetical protein